MSIFAVVGWSTICCGCLYNCKFYTSAMRQSVTQEFDYGCGIACFAFALNMTYQQAVTHLGESQAKSERFWVKDLVVALNSFGLHYVNKYVKPHIRPKIYREGTIVLIRRSKHYPTGHYLVRHNGQWMDPWMNVRSNNDIKRAESGYRKRLPGKPMYALIPYELSAECTRGQQTND